MNCIRGTVGDVSFKEIGKFKDQKGFVEGMYRNTVFVQSGADSAVVCETIKAFIDPQTTSSFFSQGTAISRPSLIHASAATPSLETPQRQRPRWEHLSGNALAGTPQRQRPCWTVSKDCV